MFVVAILEKLCNVGLIDRNEVDSILDMVNLESFLELNKDRFFTKDETQYLDRVKDLIAQRSFVQLQSLTPPASMISFHTVLIRTYTKGNLNVHPGADI